jgi:hypothetical protein
MLCSLVTDLMVTEFQCGECLYEGVKEVRRSSVPIGGRVMPHKVVFLSSFSLVLSRFIASVKLNSDDAVI